MSLEWRSLRVTDDSSKDLNAGHGGDLAMTAAHQKISHKNKENNNIKTWQFDLTKGTEMTIQKPTNLDTRSDNVRQSDALVATW